MKSLCVLADEGGQLRPPAGIACTFCGKDLRDQQRNSIIKMLPARRGEDGKQIRQEDGKGGMAVPQQLFRKAFADEALRLP